ncbi:MAG: histidine kinase [Bryobacter sp.]|nr:histidine kinase [Bryobacter sp.]
MRIRSGAVLAIAFAGLLSLIVFSLLAARQKTQEVYTQLDEVNMLHRHMETMLRRVRSELNLSGVFIRDYLLDNTLESGLFYRQQLAKLRKSTLDALEELERTAGPAATIQDRLKNLRGQLEEYWETFDPVLDWTAEQKNILSYSFLRRSVIPRREAVLSIAREIEELNNANIAEQRAEVAAREREFHSSINRMMVASVLFGLVLAAGAVYRVTALERKSEKQRFRAEAAESEMRNLSHQLVNAHEEERRTLSRELHDEVGQILTGLRMELNSVEIARNREGPEFARHLSECKELVDQVIHTVRDLSMGLRPSILDDLGLGAALEWQSRDFFRRYQVPVHVTVEGGADHLGEPYRTSIYRMVQEALTNCARHANATQISISLRRSSEQLSVLIQDDGIGFGARQTPELGLGLLGMKERVRELAGQVALHSNEGAGTTIKITIPLKTDLTVIHAENIDS